MMGMYPQFDLRMASDQTAVKIGEAVIRPGDLIFADCDGVVVVPFEEEDTVMAKAVQKHEQEKEILRRILSGENSMHIYGFDRLVQQKLQK
jgi:4-hydroxy-4-methyl-2-oxoglutarate aldolase